jgi:hypothetical protein
MGINFDENTDEYEPETGTILPRLAGAKSVDDVQTIIYAEFCRWFGEVEAGENYKNVSAKVWDACEQHFRRPDLPRRRQIIRHKADDAPARCYRTKEEGLGVVALQQRNSGTNCDQVSRTPANARTGVRARAGGPGRQRRVRREAPNKAQRSGRNG